MVTPFVVIFFTQIVGLTGKTVGSGIAIASLIGIVLVFLTAGQIDRRGGRPILILSVLLISLATFLYAWSNSAWAFLGAALLLHVASQSYWPAIDTVTTSVAQKDKVITSMSIIRVSMALGIGVGGFIGGLMVAGGGLTEYRMMFMAGAIISAMATFLIWFMVPNHKPQHQSATGEQLVGSWKEVFADRLFVYAMLLLFILVLGFTQVTMSVPAFLRDQAGISEGFIGALFMMNTIFVLFFQVPVAARVDRGNTGKLMALGAIFWAAAFGFLILTVGIPPTAMLVFFAFTLGELLFMPISSVLAVRLAPEHLRGRYFALLSFTWGGSFAIAAFTAGAALDTASPLFLWPIMMVAMVLAAIGAFQLRNNERLLPPVASVVEAHSGDSDSEPGAVEPLTAVVEKQSA